jgi:hypothetical protein
MSTDTVPTAEAKRGLAEVIHQLTAGKRDPDTVRKSCERMDRMREEIQKRVGTVEVAVEFIRELRDQ